MINNSVLSGHNFSLICCVEQPRNVVISTILLEVTVYRTENDVQRTILATTPDVVNLTL